MDLTGKKIIWNMASALEEDEKNINYLTELGMEPFAITQVMIQPEKNVVSFSGKPQAPRFANRIWFKQPLVVENKNAENQA